MHGLYTLPIFAESVIATKIIINQEKINMPKKVPEVPTHREILNKLSELEAEHKLLGDRYNRLKKQLEGKDNLDSGDRFLSNYWR